jgi:ABC-type amino acid transport substrate-binding protein
VIAPLTYEPIGIPLPPNDPLLVNWVENVLTKLKGSSELKALQKYWFRNASWLEKVS